MRNVIVAGWALWLGVACGPSVGTSDDEGGSTGEEPMDAGERPGGRGAMYSACSMVSTCDPLEFCVFPPDESGFCSDACVDGPDRCDPAPGTGASVSCLDIGLGDGRTVCALDCSDGPCPSGMRCEAIDTASGRRDICF